MSIKDSYDTIGNQTRDLPASSAVPQPTALPRAPIYEVIRVKYEESVYIFDPVVRNAKHLFCTLVYCRLLPVWLYHIFDIIS
jgi:hypothetical protein